MMFKTTIFAFPSLSNSLADVMAFEKAVRQLAERELFRFANGQKTFSFVSSVSADNVSNQTVA